MPDECLDDKGQMFKSSEAQKWEKAKNDTERWNRLMQGGDKINEKYEKEKESKETKE